MKFSPKIKIICAVYVLSALSFCSIHSQTLKVVKNPAEYHQLLESDTLKHLVELKDVIPAILYDLRYATAKNFTGEILYASGENTFLRKEAALHLKKVQEELNEKGYGLKIFDAYRPYSVTKKMWDLIQDERYVAHPTTGSGHNRGIAVDLTIVHLETNMELDMGTGYDNFTDTAHHDFIVLPDTVLQNRKMLREIMEKHGFRKFQTEWWHYSWPNDRNYEVMDLSFEMLRETE